MRNGVERVNELLQNIILSKDAPSQFEPIREYLRLVRELRLRQSDTVATYGSILLNKFKGSIPNDEFWTVMEQVAEAALDVHAVNFAFSLVSEIRKKFPGSQRAQRITAMYLEAKGKVKEAEDIVNKLLEDQPDSLLGLRRQVAVEKTKGNLWKAIELLRNYVDTFMTDKEAWEELADLYLQVQQYPQAAHCYEELLLHSPQSVPLHVQYADVLYTIGGANLRTARRHYAAAVKLSGGENVRALYGLCSTSSALSGQKGRQQKDDEDEELSASASEVLVRRYSEENEEQLPLIKELLKAQGFAAR